MTQEKTRFLAYICPKCRQSVIVEKDVFALAAAPARIQCPCGQSELTVEFMPQRVTMSVPCVACGRDHLVSCPTHAFLREKALAFSCAASGLDCCYVGEEGPVYAATARLERAVDKLEHPDQAGGGPDQEETTAGADTGTQPVPVPSGESTDDASADPVDSDGCASAAGVLWLFPAVAVAAPLLFFRRSYHRCGGHRRMVCLLLLSGLVVLPSCAGAQNGQTNTRPPENFTDGQSEGSQKTEEPAEPDGGIMLSEEIVDGDLRIYPVPDSYRRSDTAVITVNGHAAPLVYIGSVYDPLSNYDTCSFAAGIDAPVILEITVQADIQEYEISCQSTEPRAEIDGRTLTIVTDGPHDMIVRIDNLREIVICADPPETDVPPPEGDGIYNVATQYGADTRGRELATAAFYKAIRDAAGAGGGIVYVPDGVYLLSNLILQSNVSLYLESGAYLMCTEDTAVLTESERKTTEHGHTVDYPISWMFTTASGSENIRIFGRGTIDGQGALMKLKHGWLINLIRTNITSDFTLEGVTLRDSSHWGCIIYQSTRVDIRGTKHLNLVKNLNEDDGIDVCSSREVEVLDTVVIAQDVIGAAADEDAGLPPLDDGTDDLRLGAVNPFVGIFGDKFQAARQFQKPADELFVRVPHKAAFQAAFPGGHVNQVAVVKVDAQSFRQAFPDFPAVASETSADCNYHLSFHNHSLPNSL